MVNSYKDFTNLYSVSKTLRFELRPQGKTMENLDKAGFLEKDEERAKSYIIMKRIIDDYHKQFIDECLSKIDIDWRPLSLAIDNHKKIKDDKTKKLLEIEQKKKRDEIISLFKNDERFVKMFSEKLISDLITPNVINCGNLDDIKALNDFKKFSVYFLGLHENRKNMYSNEAKHTSIAYRIVNENFSKHFENCYKYALICENIPEVILNAKNELSGKLDLDLDKAFSIEYFNNIVRQRDITAYNTAIGGIADENSKIRGINELLNLNSQISDEKRIKLTPLFKQILSDRNSYSYIPQVFNNDDEVLSSVDEFYKNMEIENIFSRIVYLLNHYNEYDLSKVYVDGKEIPLLSIEIFNTWDILGGLMQELKAEEFGDSKLEKNRKKIDKWLSSSEFPLDVILNAIARSGTDKDFTQYINNVAETISCVIEKRKLISLNPGVNLSSEESNVQELRLFLDSIMHLLHMIKPFFAEEDADRDIGFYSEFDEIYSSLSTIIPLYNKVRNYATKKKFNESKIKLNFSIPTLADGWDQNKEPNNKAVIFLRDRKYYLGIIDPKKMIKFDKINTCVSTECYQKMVYKLLPSPNKMLPKVFFSKKGLKIYNPSEKLLEAYNQGKHKKGDNFDIKFCHELIDFFKSSIIKNPDWKCFNFKFSPTESYEDISQFYKEVEKQGYNISFVCIPTEVIDEYVDSGRLYLFQLYTKDFSDKSTGTKNMHTLYWDAAFSDENLKDVVIQINGQAELFFRKKSDMKIITHRAGEILVNRMDSNRNPIPDKIYYELLRFKNGIITKLSDEAKNYKTCINSKEAKYDIVKDRRYTEDRMFFHIPLTLNFKSDNKNNINKMVLDYALSNRDLHIIGIDRGERNLIYVSVINRQGKIIEQRSFNVLDNIDYHEKLDQREKERAESRKSWNSIEKIRDLKEGYLSKVVYKISQMIVEYNAIVILEDLNFGFKRGRFKVEKQVYQKFESALISKLNYLVFKEGSQSLPGGVLNAYQLTDKMDTFAKIGKQTGVLFYVNAAYTSKIDPATGFVDIFNTSSVKNNETRKEFVRRFESIVYDAVEDMFAITFDYRDYVTSKTDFKNRWTVYTNGIRLKYSPKYRKHYSVDPTNDIKESLKRSGIEYLNGENIKDMIFSNNKDCADLINTVYYSFQDTLRMRNSDQTSDYIISPVKNSNGVFFNTSNGNPEYPVDADANGAYHIALKGELMLRLLEQNYDSDVKQIKIPLIDSSSWFKFVQTRRI